jgi:hypothetical protein
LTNFIILRKTATIIIGIIFGITNNKILVQPYVYNDNKKVTNIENVFSKKFGENLYRLFNFVTIWKVDVGIKI